MVIGERIKKIREEKKLSMAAFGDKIQIASSAVSRMEKGQRPVTDRTITLICNEFKINEHWLRTGEGEVYNKVDEDIDYMRLLGAMAAENNDTVKRLMFKIRQLKDGEKLAIETLVDSILKEDESLN